ncbi:CopG family transcriptional regulator [Corynebacterium sp. CCUG 71335]|uniref:CopG family transcriptional regulator n=1 Tax=unclassified Corynebacterium TaxID=2624378 RepID=UPI00210C089E|nr:MULTISPECIES: CopG family transcriptional regulator [unclassified Corynebacterium]MCQ4620819.1 CopG family transcriptional regulator [Corynebacterium sp. CCUG 71335]MCQ4622783.1 CopG family transcriptional regulator [Corynebacterium sp. CCUG 70398]
MALNLRLTPEEDQQLTALAETAGTSKQKVISRLIRQEWEISEAKRANERDFWEIMDARSELMERLKNA